MYRKPIIGSHLSTYGTITLGIRIQRNILRAALKRRFVEIQLPFTDNSRNGKVDVKLNSFKDGEVTSV